MFNQKFDSRSLRSLNKLHKVQNTFLNSAERVHMYAGHLLAVFPK